jgi:hypothetical protein
MLGGIGSQSLVHLWNHGGTAQGHRNAPPSVGICVHKPPDKEYLWRVVSMALKGQASCSGKPFTW